MEIISVRNKILLSDGWVRSEYLLSSPVTKEVLNTLSQGKHEYTGWQYLSPTYLITNHEGVRISGTLKSPVIIVESLPGMPTGIEDYLHAFLSTIPDSEKPDYYLSTISQNVIRFLKQRLQ